MFKKEFLEKTNISHDTLRYYKKLGLLNPTKKHKYWSYTEADVKKMKTVLSLKSIGFRLKEIDKIFISLEDVDCKHQATLPFLKSKEVEVDLKLKELKVIKKEISESIKKFKDTNCTVEMTDFEI